MTILSIDPENIVYIILGIDKDAHDQVLAVYRTYDDAKKYCTKNLIEAGEFYDTWIEKHEVK